MFPQQTKRRKRLTPLGKALVGAVVLLVAFVIYQKVKPEPTPPDYSAPAELAWKMPFEDAQQRDAFAGKARPVYDPCVLFGWDDYTALRGEPLTLNAYVDPNYRTNPFYLYDPETKTEYLPVYPLADEPGAVGKVIEQTQGDVEALGDCAGRVAVDGSTVIPLLVAWPRSKHPAASLVRVEGGVWWDSADAQVALGKEPLADWAPVIKAGAVDPLKPSQATNPATETRVLNFVVRTGAGAVRLSRVEFAVDETRVWVQLINKGGRTLPPWPAEAATLQQAGGSVLSASTGSITDQEGPEEASPAQSDSLPSDSLSPYQRQAGYIRFPEVDPSKSLILTIPELHRAERGDAESERLQGANPIRVRIEPPR